MKSILLFLPKYGTEAPNLSNFPHRYQDLQARRGLCQLGFDIGSQPARQSSRSRCQVLGQHAGAMCD